jgi:hypothetical protein
MSNAERESPLLRMASERNAKQKIWDYLVRNMNGWNTITVIQTKAAAELGMTRQHFGVSIKKLEEERFIVKIGKSQTNNIYMVNPHDVWNGDANAHAAGMSKFNKIVLGDKAAWLDEPNEAQQDG